MATTSDLQSLDQSGGSKTTLDWHKHPPRQFSFSRVFITYALSLFLFFCLLYARFLSLFLPPTSISWKANNKNLKSKCLQQHTRKKERTKTWGDGENKNTFYVGPLLRVELKRRWLVRRSGWRRETTGKDNKNLKFNSPIARTVPRYNEHNKVETI